MSIINDALNKVASTIDSPEQKSSSEQKSSKKWIILLLFGITVPVILIGLILFKGPRLKVSSEAQAVKEVAGDEVIDEIIKEPTEQKSTFARPPEFSLTGIVWEDERPFAFINDIIVEEGDVINGAKVVKINPQEVTLSFEQKDIYLSLGK